MLLSNLEYIPLRILRRYLFKDKLLSKIEKKIPYYKVNQGQLSPVPIVDLYSMYCSKAGINTNKINILEVGPGCTNSTGYEISARTKSKYIGFEPYSDFDESNDRLFLSEICERYQYETDYILSKVCRTRNMEYLNDQTMDLIVSYSVLEHVSSFNKLLNDLTRVLKKNGHMIHFVDYRDHFFKYPFHFLQFSDNIWNKYFNPGDLPRHRIDDHLNAFRNDGFFVEVMAQEINRSEYQKIKKHISTRFKNYPEDRIAVTRAVLLVKNTTSYRNSCFTPLNNI